MKPYYQDDYVTLYHGDCAEITPQLGKFDLLLTDPPYGISYASNPIVGKGKTASNHEKKDWDESAPDLSVMLDACEKAVVWGGNYFPLTPSRQWFIWHKPDVPPSMSRVEMAWTSEDALAKIFHWSIGATNAQRLGHPTQKPLELISWCLSHFPDAKTVFDPFAGSGTTGRACKDLGLKCTLIEREESYCEIIARRMAQEVFNFA